MQEGQFLEVAGQLTAREAEIRLDPIPLSKATELATLAFCLAQTGATVKALELVALVVEDAGSMTGLSSGDYCIELICRTLRESGRSEEAQWRAAQHSHARNSAIRRPFAPFFRELSRATPLASD